MYKQSGTGIGREDGCGRDTAGGNSKFNVLDLFAGCGGFSKGFKQADFMIGGACQWEPKRPGIARTYEANHPSTQLINADITLSGTKATICNIFWDKTCDVIIGGPPCVASSMAGKRDPNDPRGKLWWDYLEIVERLNPHFCVMENVPGILSPRRGEEVPVIDLIVAGFGDLGYRVEYRILNSADYGVPQKRRRVIIMATKLDVTIRFPEPTHAKFASKSGDILPWVSVRDAIADLEDLPEDRDFWHVFVRSSPEYVKRIRQTPVGQSVNDDYGEAAYRNPPDQPAITVKANNGGVLVHYSQDRLMSPRELARLQGFDDSFRFLGTKGEVLVQIGNAVPVGLSRAVATAVRGMLEEARTHDEVCDEEIP